MGKTWTAALFAICDRRELLKLTEPINILELDYEGT